jgi:hypothetical protein
MPKCKGCGKTIIFGHTQDGRAVPLDPKPPVYDTMTVEGKIRIRRNRSAMVTHFATCPNASDFSRSKPQDREVQRTGGEDDDRSGKQGNG